MSTTIRRTEPADRLKVSMTQADFEASLQYTVDQYDKAAETDSNFAGVTKDTLRLRIEEAFHLRGGPITDFPPLFWPLGLDRPQLDAGQHRREAFLNVVDPRREVTCLTFDTIKVTYQFPLHHCTHCPN